MVPSSTRKKFSEVSRLANFDFLANKSDYRAFSKDCIDAENAFESSFDSCVKLARSALDAAVKWVYNKDKNFAAQRKKLPADKKDNLFDLIANPTFERAVGKDLLSKLHYCRKVGNAALHNEKEFSEREAIKCLQNLFDFVQWLDGRYGKNFTPRSFDAGEIPVKDPTWKKALKGAGLVALGVIATLFLSGDKDKH